MSLLDSTPEQPDPVKMKARRLRQSPRQIFQMILHSWTQGMELVWLHDNPQDILDELGTDASELVQMSAALAAFLEGFKPGVTDDIVALQQPLTVNEDGTVTIDIPEPTPTPTPEPSPTPTPEPNPTPTPTPE